MARTNPAAPTAERAGTRTAATAIWRAAAAVSVVLPRLCAVTIASATPSALVVTEPGDTEAMLGFAVANNTSSPTAGAPPRVSVARAVAVWAGSSATLGPSWPDNAAGGGGAGGEPPTLMRAV